MQFNFFSWIREGVRQSVLLGVNDAVEALGTPPGDNVWKDHIGGLLTQSAPMNGLTETAGGKRKRLGRSLKDFSTGSHS